MTRPSTALGRRTDSYLSGANPTDRDSFLLQLPCAVAVEMESRATRDALLRHAPTLFLAPRLSWPLLWRGRGMRERRVIVAM